MNMEATRFRDLIGPHCPATRCGAQVIRCTDGRQDLLIHPQPETEGDYKITDTGGQIPHARRLTVSQRFGLQGTLHTRHEPTCGEYQRWKRGQR